jgi:hypothetical protein
MSHEFSLELEERPDSLWYCKDAMSVRKGEEDVFY